MRLVYFDVFKLRCSSAETALYINVVWGQGSVNENIVQSWSQKFRRRGFDLEDEEGYGRPSAVDDYKLKSLVGENKSATVRKVVEKLRVRGSTVSEHQRKLKSRMSSTDGTARIEWVPKNSPCGESSTLFLHNKHDPFLDHTLTCDKKFSVTTTDDRHSGWTSIKHRSPCRSRSYTRRR